ncbi:MAG TPA: DUF554 domain-containing protein [Deltaproteobacteria bacterium]|nr:DUF554 domain-containing protein [Deltaproteobacteria bacterium]
MKGTLVNASTILVGSLIGMGAGRLLSQGIRTILMQALGLAVMVIGIKMALSGENAIAAVGCLLLGGLTGELLRIEDGIEYIGTRLKDRFHSESATFVEGFVSATILYLTGAMTIVGSIQDGTVGDATTLYLKALLDGFASVVLASSLGVGVAFSALSVLVVQGGLTLLAGALTFLKEPAVLTSLTATGGMIILGIGINLLEIKRLKVGNLVPALVYAIIYPLLWK